MILLALSLCDRYLLANIIIIFVQCLAIQDTVRIHAVTPGKSMTVGVASNRANMVVTVCSSLHGLATWNSLQLS